MTPDILGAESTFYLFLSKYIGLLEIKINIDLTGNLSFKKKCVHSNLGLAVYVAELLLDNYSRIHNPPI